MAVFDPRFRTHIIVALCAHFVEGFVGKPGESFWDSGYDHRDGAGQLEAILRNLDSADDELRITQTTRNGTGASEEENERLPSQLCRGYYLHRRGSGHFL